MKKDGNIKQIYMSNDGDWGGIKVDQTFDEFLLDILGMKTMDRFRNEDKVDYFNLCREFEVKNVEFIQIARYKLPSAYR
jgi:hypothetical protein